MATISITIADTDLQRVINAICGVFGYQATITNQLGQVTPNPVTPAQFARQMVVQDVKSWVKTWEVQEAAETASVTAGANADGVGVS